MVLFDLTGGFNFIMFVIPDWNDYHLFSSMFSDCIGTRILQITVF